MVGSGYWEAIHLFQDALQAAVARVAMAILLRNGPFPFREPIGQLYLSEPSARLGSATSNRSMWLAMRFRLEPVVGDRWEIRTFAYTYVLFRDDREEIAYHWDSEATGTGTSRLPHMHVGKDLASTRSSPQERERLGELAAAHLPTGLIPFTAILRTAIQDLGGEPLRLRGESEAETRVRAERSFEQAEAALIASFAWWTP